MQELPLTSSPFGFQTHFLCGFKSKCVYVCACREGWWVIAIYRVLRIDNASLNWSTRTHREKPPQLWLQRESCLKTPERQVNRVWNMTFWELYLISGIISVLENLTYMIRPMQCKDNPRETSSVSEPRQVWPGHFLPILKKVKARMKFKLLLIGIFTGLIIF